MRERATQAGQITTISNYPFLLFLSRRYASLAPSYFFDAAFFDGARFLGRPFFGAAAGAASGAVSPRRAAAQRASEPASTRTVPGASSGTCEGNV